MTEVFGTVYASTYDALYSDKDYAAEVQLIESIFKKYGPGNLRTILDLGCGTGNHLLPFLRKGYDVIGIDRSHSMLTQVLRKAAGSARFIQADIRNVHLKFKCDAVLMMFAVLGYQLENNDVLAALRTARRHLEPTGLLLFDVWYGPAVLSQKPADRMKIITLPDAKILRTASSDLNIRKHVCTVTYHLWELREDSELIEIEEKHSMRYFFPAELDLFLSSVGFRMLRLGAFPDIEKEPDESSWNVMGVARAI